MLCLEYLEMLVLIAKCHLRLVLRMLSRFLGKDRGQYQEHFLICKSIDFIYNSINFHLR